MSHREEGGRTMKIHDSVMQLGNDIGGPGPSPVPTPL